MFPPVLIEVEGGGKRFTEMHVDGGITTNVLVLPEAMMTTNRAMPTHMRPKFYVILNGKLGPNFELVNARTLPITIRSFETSVRANTHNTLLATYEFIKRRGWNLNLTAIEDSVPPGKNRGFDAEYMRRLFDYGYEARGARPDVAAVTGGSTAASAGWSGGAARGGAVIAASAFHRRQEIEIAALIGLLHMLAIEPCIAARGLLWNSRRAPGILAFFKFGVVDQQVRACARERRAGCGRRFSPAPAVHRQRLPAQYAERWYRTQCRSCAHPTSAPCP